MEITPAQNFVTRAHVEVVEKLSSMRLAVTAAKVYFNLHCLVELHHLHVDSTVNVRETVATQEYHTAAMAMTNPALSVLFSYRDLACAEGRR